MPQDMERINDTLPAETLERLTSLARSIAGAKERGRGVVVCTGSGPNLHEGVTTLIAELIERGIVDGVLTSSAVLAHEMAGALDRVHRFDGRALGMDPAHLPMDGRFEISVMEPEDLARIEEEMPLDRALIDRGLAAPGENIIKAAGNMAYPLGLRTESLAHEALGLAWSIGQPLERVVGLGADPHTMIGAAARRRVPVLVSVPQLVGGGAVGLSVGDAITVSERSARIARLLEASDVIIESAVALTQEIHDGPFETWTGHGIWPHWEGKRTYSLHGKVLARLDLDPNLQRAWEHQRHNALIQEAIAKGLPKTKLTGIPFRMEMSGFARLESSLPIIGDIGRLWPVLAKLTADALGVELDFLPAPQETPAGREMREWIVRHVKMVDRDRMRAGVREQTI